MEFNMIKYIGDSPRALKETLSRISKSTEKVAELLVNKKYDRVVITGCGSSYHTALAAKYAFRYFKKDIYCIPASEIVFSSNLFDEGTILLAISRTGEKGFTIDAAKRAKSRSSLVISITAYADSLLASLSDDFIQTFEGTEYSNPATKSVLAQLVALYLLSIDTLQRTADTDDLTDIKDLRTQILSSPKFVQDIINAHEGKAKKLARELSGISSAFIVGGGTSYVTALESALKIKETSLVHAEGLPIGEFIHGPILTLAEKNPVILIETCGKTYSTSTILAKELEKMKVDLISVINERDDVVKEYSRDYFEIPDVINDAFSPLLYLIPFQLFSYYLAVSRGLNPDEPKYLGNMLKLILEPGRIYREIAPRRKFLTK